jgi:hypothetical protein
MKNSQKGFAVPLLLAIIVLLVIGGGIYIYQIKNSTTTKVDSNNNETQQVNSNIQPSITSPASVQTGSSAQTNISNSNAPKPRMTILSPNGGESWQEGKVYEIKWSAMNIPGDQIIRLADSNNRVIKIIDSNVNTVNGGTGNYQYSWSIPQTLVSEASPGKFKILISSSDNTISDSSDNYFNIIANSQITPSITVLAPKENEVWKRNSIQKIQYIWQNAPSGFGDKVSIYLKIPCPAGYSCDTFAPYNGSFTIAKDVYNTGSYDWTVGQTIECGMGNTAQCPVPNTVYQLKVCSSNGKICDSKNITVSTDSNSNTNSNLWPTYLNYGFSIKYPSNWIAKENLGAQNTVIEIRSPEHDKYLRDNPNAPYQGQYNDVIIVVHGYPWTAYNANSVQSTTLNGLNALKYDYSGVYEAETYIVSNNQTKTFTITSLSLPSDDATRKAILSSFALTN